MSDDEGDNMVDYAEDLESEPGDETEKSEVSSEDEDDDEELSETPIDDNQSVTTEIKYIPKEKASSKQKNIIYVPLNMRMTSHMMQTNEYANLVATRASQIEQNGRHFALIKSHDPILLAKDEILNKRCPLAVMREVDIRDGCPVVEVWKSSELN
jgi:hypothetical protein